MFVFCLFYLASDLTDADIRPALQESDDENCVSTENDSDDEDFVPDTVSDYESNFTETAPEEEDEQLCTNDENTDVEMNNHSNSIMEYFGKDGTMWKAKPKKTGRTKRHNIVSSSIHKVVLPPGKVISHPIDSFNLFFDNTSLELIVKHTNSEAKRVLKNEWKPMDVIELQAFLGLLLTTGVDKQSKMDFRE